MKMSGKVSHQCDVLPLEGVATELDDDTLQLLKTAYKKIIPRFSEYCDLSLQKEGVPSALRGDAELLQGPLNPVYVHKKFTVEDSNTGRLVTYALKSQQSSCDHSFVQLLSGYMPPVFGRIKMCFTHTFAGYSSRYLLLDIYEGLSKIHTVKYGGYLLN